MKTVENLSGLGEEFGGGVPDPSRAVPQHHSTRRFGETSAGSLAQNALGEGGEGRE